MTSWLVALAPRAGALVAAAEPLAPLTRGSEGLVALARRIEWFADQDDADEDAERRFVEAAGAWLGLLLLDHVGEGAFVRERESVRVRLGRYGFVDPFAAVQSALDAEDPRRTLAHAVRDAEAEARGEGPVSRVASVLEQALVRGGSGLRIETSREAHVTLTGGIEIDLGRVIAATRDANLAAVERAVDKVLALLGEGDTRATLAWGDAAERLLPRLVAHSFLEELAATADRGAIAATEVGHDVAMTLVLAYPGRVRYVRTDEVAAFGVSEAEVRRTALRNLAGRSESARFASIETEHGPLVVSRTGDGLDAARLLLPTLHEVLEPVLGSPFYAAVPHRDALLACPTEPAALVALFEERTRQAAARAPHRISPAVFRVDATGPVAAP